MSGIRVLFVCTANVSRSPYAEHRARQMAGPQSTLQFDSAGVVASLGEPMDPMMRAELERRGGRCPSGLTARPLPPAISARPDLILTAESAHRQAVLDDWPRLLGITYTMRHFAAVAGAVDTGVAGRDLVEAVRGKRHLAGRAADIADPYRRGARAAARAADLIDQVLMAVVPRLEPR